MSAAELVIVYALRHPQGWETACDHGRTWGRLYTDIHTLDDDHIAVVFWPAPDGRWRPWERVRRRWILEGRQERAA